jgi:phospholipid/cholesterol/gamma-HCH transport system permease protein
VNKEIPSEKLAFNYLSPEKIFEFKFVSDWRISAGLPELKEAISQLSNQTEIKQVKFDSSELTFWDSGFISFLMQLVKECQRRKIEVLYQGLPRGADRLLKLALQVKENIILKNVQEEHLFARIGSLTLQRIESVRLFLNFLGQLVTSFLKLINGKSVMRWDDFLLIVQRSGANAFGLVSLISVLVGMILAFVGAIQLQLFGAQVFIADIVGIAMVRVMGAVMTAVLMAGRTGASFAAELGIMQVNEEIDAYRTLGVDPVEFLVLPRVMALVLMMPLLTIYADLMGILGGFLIGTGMLGLNPFEYLNRTQQAVKLNNLWVGLTHSVVFGIIIALAGCFRGMRCGRSAASVGEATTSAVVTGITSIVIATAIITFICQVLGV